MFAQENAGVLPHVAFSATFVFMQALLVQGPLFSCMTNHYAILTIET